MTVSKHGKWPGVVAFANDGMMICVECAMDMYGDKIIRAVIDGDPGYDQYTDHEGNPFNAVLYGSEDLHGQHCEGLCLEEVRQGELREEDTYLCDDDCACYGKEEEDIDEGDEDDEDRSLDSDPNARRR